MKKLINVATGEVKFGEGRNILISNAIGSCIVVAAMNLVTPLACLAHILLPGKAPKKEKTQKTKYSIDAIDRLLEFMQVNDDTPSNLCFCIVGAGNVLKKKMIPTVRIYTIGNEYT